MNKSDQLQRQIQQANEWPRQIGKSHYLKHLKGEHLTRDEAIQAKCYECTCGEDAEPCNAITCPLHKYCQWNK